MKIKSKFLKVLLIVVTVLIVFFVTMAIIPPKDVIEDNPFIIEKGARPLVAAHRGGKILNPENTFKAFNAAYEEYNVDILELDTVLTKDNELILIHNTTLNSCTDIEVVNNSDEDYYVSDHTLEEIQKLNFGYNFKKNDEYPYRNILEGVSDEDKSKVLKENDLRVVTIEELFEKFKDTDLMFIVEIKDSEDRGFIATDKLISYIKEYKLEKRVVVGTFHPEIENKLQTDYPEIMRGASTSGAAKFVITQMLGVNLFDNSDFTCLQIPTSYDLGIEFKLDKKSYIRRAHRRNISVQFWTINDKEEMKHLIELGADVIMTDAPDLLIEVINEMGLK